MSASIPEKVHRNFFSVCLCALIKVSWCVLCVNKAKTKKYHIDNPNDSNFDMELHKLKNWANLVIAIRIPGCPMSKRE